MSVPPSASALVAAAARVAALREVLQARQRSPVRLAETHLSWVLLTTEHAYKLKKPLRLPFVDFSTLALRRHFCAEELRLNRRLAPTLYLDVVEVREGAGGLTFDGDGALLDVAVKMRRFPDGALWSERVAAGELTPHDVDGLALRLADFHRHCAVAAVASGFGSTALHERVTLRLVQGLDAAAPSLMADGGWAALRAWALARPALLAPVFEARCRDGRVRECHGDLHLANLIEVDGDVTAFDGIEFDPALRWIDVLDDVAFVAMDLMAHAHDTLAWRFLDAWFEATGDFDGLPALRFALVSRALVRAQVAVLSDAQHAARPGAGEYLALAARLSTAHDPRLAITHGLPGSGKSVVSQALSEQAGAVRVRSDVERKRLFGIGALQSSQGRIAGGIYDSASTQRTYARLLDVARTALGAGWPVIVDAAFMRADERRVFAALAEAQRAPFTIVDCQAPAAVLRDRLARRNARGDDASEADAAVLETLSAVAEPLGEAERACAIRMDAAVSMPPVALARQWLAAPLCSAGEVADGCAH
ncbi:MAG: AAA family ATPase [Burkholderiales bacterium]